MRILALQTDPGVIKQLFIVEGEQELLTTARNGFVFFIGMLGTGAVTMVAALLVVGVTFLISNVTTAVWFESLLLLLCGAYFLISFLRQYIDWRFNFLVVTTEKVVIVRQWLFFYQRITPIHLSNITSTSIESQFWGIVNCGILRLRLREGKRAETRIVTIPYIPKFNVVAGVIDNATILAKQKAQPAEEEGKEDQQHKIETVKEKAEEVPKPPEQAQVG